MNKRLFGGRFGRRSGIDRGSRSRIRPLVAATLLTASTLLAATDAYADILVISPHPDDDVLIASGVIYRAAQSGVPVRIVYVTNGDLSGVSVGYTRQGEAVNAVVNHLGLREDDLIFLGYPGGYLQTVYSSYPGTTDVFTAPHGQSTTYGNRGLGRKDYHTYRFGAAANYNRPNIVADLRDILQTYRPSHIFTTAEFDDHADHATTYALLTHALSEAFAVLPDYSPTVHRTSVWPLWQNPMDPTGYLAEGPNLEGTGLIWSQRESLDVPIEMQSLALQGNPKYGAIGEHYSQNAPNNYAMFVHKDEVFWVSQPRGGNAPPIVRAGTDQTVPEGAQVQLNALSSSDPDGNPLSFAWRQAAGPPVALSNAAAPTPTFTAPSGLARTTTLVFELVVADGAVSSVADAVSVIVRSPLDRQWGGNVAPSALVTASSENASGGQFATNVIDGVADGFPGDHTKEWASIGERAGAWILLQWPQPVTVGQVVLFDRPNVGDFITRGTLEFSDGSTVTVGPLDNWGRQSVFAFAPRTVTSIRLHVDATSAETQNVGLSEIAVFEVLDNHVPVANAGTNQIANENALVQLSGAASVDADADPLTYRWTQLSGYPVALSSPTAVNPQLTTPGDLVADQVLVFGLVVNDGRTDSVPHTVQVRVVAANPGAPVNLAPYATVTGSSENASAGQLVVKAIDRVVDGYPGDPTKEWSTAGERTNAWIQLAWAGSQVVDQIVLHDRPNANDQILGAVLQFSDGTAVTLGPLPNDGGPAAFAFAARSVVSLRVTVTAVSASTQNVGLAELVVFGPSRTGPTNRAPIAAAGTDRSVDQGGVVQLDGTGSADPDGDPITFRWTQTGGVAVQLSNPASPQPTFSAPAGLQADEVLTFALVVNDGQLDSSPSTVRITVLGPPPPGTNIAPTALVTASSENVSTGQRAVKAVDGIADGYPGDYTREWATIGERAGAWLELSWSQVHTIDRVVLHDRPNLSDQVLSATLLFSDGSTVAIGPLPNGGTPVTYTFTPRQANRLRFRVDGVDPSTNNIGLAEILVFDSTWTPPPNQPPVAAAGPDQTTTQGATVQLDGTGSTDSDGDPLTFLWSQTGGTPVTLSAASSPQPTFIAPSSGSTTDDILTFSLVVYDGLAQSAPDSVSVTVSGVPVNRTPIAAAGPDQTVSQGAVVQLDGAGSTDPDGGALSYSWTQVAGTPVTLSSTTASRPTFTAPTGASSDEVLRFQLIVNDGQLDSAPDTVDVTIDAPAAPGTNVARVAAVTASSEKVSTGQLAIKAVDGVAAGFPTSPTNEWATEKQRVGAWIELRWATPQTVDRLVLYDRPNLNEHIRGATVRFSDGSTLTIGELPNNGSAASYTFTARTVTSVRMTVTSVSPKTSHVGLAEFEVFTSGGTQP